MYYQMNSANLGMIDKVRLVYYFVQSSIKRKDFQKLIFIATRY